MKANFKIYPIVIVGLLSLFLFSCKKEHKKVVPTISTAILASSNITSTTVTLGGEIPSDGGATVTARGVCWSLNPNPTIADNKTSDGTGSGSFTSSITGLSPGTTYYIRTYATNSIGTVYGTELTVTTLAILSTTTTTVASAITSTTVTSGGNIINDGGSTITARGVCWSLSPNPAITDNKTSDGTGKGIFTSTITGLTPGATYYIRTYATNSIGTAYGEQITVTMLAILPTVTTTVVSAITVSTASSGGNITNNGGAGITARGVCWSLNATPTIVDNKTVDGNGSGSFSSNLTGLIANNTYYVRAYATNVIGTAYGSILSFKALNNGLTSDINNFVPQSIIDEMKRLGMPINTGNTPPNIEGIFNISPLTLKASDVPNEVPLGYIFADMHIQFTQQDNSKLKVNVDYVEGSSSGSSTTSYIVGSGNKFSVFVNTTVTTTDGSKYLDVEVYSGIIEATSIKDCYYSFFMIENYGNTHVISNGTGRVFYDGDGLSEKISSLKSALIKNSITTNISTILSIMKR